LQDDLGMTIWTCAIEAIASTSDPIVTDLDHLASYNFADHRRVPSEGSRVKVIRRMRAAPAAGRGPRDSGVLLTTFAMNARRSAAIEVAKNCQTL
jgi:hypothetical protein